MKAEGKKTKKASSKKTENKEPQGHRYCSAPVVQPRSLGPEVLPDRARAIIVTSNKWVNGTVLKYYFFDKDSDGETAFSSSGRKSFIPWKGTKAQEDVVRKAFKMWKDAGIGLEFREVKSREEAEIRIGFMPGDGSWSYIGRDILRISSNRRTMNFGWDISRHPRELDTALHEIGHTLGLPHEHQNPIAGIVWDEEAVYSSLGGPPNNWSRETTFHNIIRKIDPDTVQGSNWDADSIMHYPFGPGMIKEPAQFSRGLDPKGGLSPRDVAWIKQFYPPIKEKDIKELREFESFTFEISAGEQKDFYFLPKVTRSYNIRTFGMMDTVMVLFEEENGELQYRAGDDDSGFDRNAAIKMKLIADHKYVIRVRLYFKTSVGKTAIMIW